MIAYGCLPNNTLRKRSEARKSGVVRAIFNSSSFCRFSRSNCSTGNAASRVISEANSKSGRENSLSPPNATALVSAPAPVDKSEPQRRKSSSICRLVRCAVPVRATVAAISASPGVAATELPLRKNSSAVNFGMVCDSTRATSSPLANLRRNRRGHTTGRSGPSAGISARFNLEVERSHHAASFCEGTRNTIAR